MVGVLCYKRGVCVRVCVCVCVFNSQRQIKNSRVNALDPSEKKKNINIWRRLRNTTLDRLPFMTALSMGI